MTILKNTTHTLIASCFGYITQAIINNFAPLLFITFHNGYNISFDKIALLVAINFCVQLCADAVTMFFADKIGYKASIVMAHLFAAVGLLSLGVLPNLFADPYIGLVLAVVIYAIGGGIIEVLVSPIVEACPNDNKSGVMSLLHSFYCWGSVAVILASTLFFVLFGIGNWPVLAGIWAVLPLLNALYFTQVPVYQLNEDVPSLPLKKLFSKKMFWIYVLLMVCAGASELAMSQWASAFAESGLNISKTAGDLAGPCMFAILMGSARVFYSKYSQKINLQKYLTGCAVLAVVGYLMASLSPLPVISLVGCGIVGLAVGIMWPGTFSMAAADIPRGGTALFALLALAGDLGCASGPAVVGLLSGFFGDNLKIGLLGAIGFPALLIVGMLLHSKIKHRTRSGV